MGLEVSAPPSTAAPQPKPYGGGRKVVAELVEFARPDGALLEDSAPAHPRPARHRLVVMGREVVDAGYWWLAAEGGVAAVMVVGVEPAVEPSSSGGF